MTPRVGAAVESGGAERRRRPTARALDARFQNISTKNMKNIARKQVIMILDIIVDL